MGAKEEKEKDGNEEIKSKKRKREEDIETDEMEENDDKPRKGIAGRIKREASKVLTF